MPKLTGSKKNEAGSKREYDFSGQENIKGSLQAASLSVNKPDLIAIGIFDEKTKKIDDDVNRIDSGPDTISCQRKFDEFLIEAIDETLSSLGAPVKNAVYFQLENSFSIPKNEIPKQIDEFTDIMHKIFGLGASRLELKFMKNLYSKIKVNIELTEYEWPLSKWIVDDMSFTKYIHNARKNYCNQQ